MKRYNLFAWKINLMQFLFYNNYYGII
jgi:hypothetical protein